MESEDTVEPDEEDAHRRRIAIDAARGYSYLKATLGRCGGFTLLIRYPYHVSIVLPVASSLRYSRCMSITLCFVFPLRLVWRDVLLARKVSFN